MVEDELKALVLEVLDDMKGRDVVCLDVSELTQLMTYMIIASGTSERHVKAVVDSMVLEAKAAGVLPLGVEGEDKGEWVLLDFADVVVHVMLPATRAFYDLERLWGGVGRDLTKETE